MGKLDGKLVFGRYALGDRLAVGGMGEVFVGRAAAGSDGDVVLKTLLPELAQQPEHVEQFLTEARVAAALAHPNIVRTLEVGLDDGTYYLVMERIDGENLATLMRTASARSDAIPIDVAVRVIHDAARALHAAHTAVDGGGVPLGIVHRDISPHNLMVSRQGITKVVDFGIAKSTLAADRTRTGTIKGKIPYMSPEQATPTSSAGDAVDARTDQFSLGIVLWELLCGRRLFRGDNEVALLLTVTECVVPAVETHRRQVPRPLASLVARMLSRDRDARFASLHDVADALERDAGGGADRELVARWVAENSPRPDSETATKRKRKSEGFVIDLRSPSSGSQIDARPLVSSTAIAPPDENIPPDEAAFVDLAMRTLVQPMELELDGLDVDRTAVDVSPLERGGEDDRTLVGPSDAACRATWARTVLAHVDNLPPATAKAVRARMPKDSLAAIEAAHALALLPLEHMARLIAASSFVLSEDALRTLFRDASRSAMDLPLLRPLAQAAIALFGGGPRAMVRVCPRAAHAIFKNSGELRVEELGDDHARVVMHGAAAAFLAAPGMGPATEGTFEAIYTFVNHSGTARVRRGEPTADDFTIDMSWIANER